MEKTKQLLALLLAVILCLSLLAACSTSESSTSTDSGSQASTTDSTDQDTSSDSAPADGETDSDVGIMGEDWEYEPETLIFYLLDDSGKNAGNEEHVEAAINELLGETYGINVDIRFGDFGSYPTNLTMAISSGEQADVALMFVRAPGNFASLYSNNQLFDMTDYLNAYATETLDLMSDYIGACTYDGRIYGIPTLRIYASNPYVVFRADVLDELGLEEATRNCSSWSELEAIWQQITDETDFWATAGGAYTGSAFACGEDAWADMTPVDVVDTIGVVLVKDDVAQSLYSWDGCISDLKQYASWNEKGFIYPDAIHTNSLQDELLSSNAVASYVTSSETGIEATKEANLGMDLTCVKICDGMIKGSNLTGWSVGIPATAELPEKAAAFINLMYTNEELMNLIAWGVEGTDYVVKDGEACYPEDMTNATYHERDFMIGNQFLVLPWEGQGADFRETTFAENESCPISNYLSFTFDADDLDTLQAGLQAVLDQYQDDLRGGYYNDEMYEEFLSKLEVAGIDEYVAAVQTQLDAWLAAQ